MPTDPVPPEWAEPLLKRLDVTLEPIGRLESSGIEDVIWACLGDCSCWFLFENTGSMGIIDRYSFVNEDGWCQGQGGCPCHQLPRSVDLEELRREDVEALKASIDTKGQ